MKDYTTNARADADAWDAGFGLFFLLYFLAAGAAVVFAVADKLFP